MHEGGRNCVKFLKKGGRGRKEGRGNKKFKKRGGKLGQGVGALKRGTETPLRTVYRDVQKVIKANLAIDNQSRPQGAQLSDKKSKFLEY